MGTVSRPGAADDLREVARELAEVLLALEEPGPGQLEWAARILDRCAENLAQVADGLRAPGSRP
jgi:hypothetical protein